MLNSNFISRLLSYDCLPRNPYFAILFPTLNVHARGEAELRCQRGKFPQETAHTAKGKVGCVEIGHTCSGNRKIEQADISSIGEAGAPSLPPPQMLIQRNGRCHFA